MFDVLGSVILGDTAATEIDHLDPENLSGGDLCHRRNVGVPPRVKWKLLLVRLLCQINRHHQPCAAVVRHILMIIAGERKLDWYLS